MSDSEAVFLNEPDNIPMQTLFAKLGFELSGVIHNLDPNDPELIYYHELTPAGSVGRRETDRPNPPTTSAV